MLPPPLHVLLTKFASLPVCRSCLPPAQTSQVSFERALGTVVGGTLGFFATALSTHWWTLVRRRMLCMLSASCLPACLPYGAQHNCCSLL